MNIFFFDKNPVRCARDHCDKHVVKMVVEYAQILSTVIHSVLKEKLQGSISMQLYLPTHENHPCVRWVRSHFSNYSYLYELFTALSEEYTYRYGKEHASFTRISPLVRETREEVWRSMRRWERGYGHGMESAESVINPDYTNRMIYHPPTVKGYFYAPPQVMPVQYRRYRGKGLFLEMNDALFYQELGTVLAYRAYFRGEKNSLAKWTKRGAPNWYTLNSDKDVTDRMERLENIQGANRTITIANPGRLRFIPGQKRPYIAPFSPPHSTSQSFGSWGPRDTRTLQATFNAMSSEIYDWYMEQYLNSPVSTTTTAATPAASVGPFTRLTSMPRMRVEPNWGASGPVTPLQYYTTPVQMPMMPHTMYSASTLPVTNIRTQILDEPGTT